MKKLLGFLALLTLFSTCVYASMDSPKWSPDGCHIQISRQVDNCFWIYNLVTHTTLEIGPTLTGGRLARWSPDGRYLAFKVVKTLEDGCRGQAAAMYDTKTASVIPLTPFMNRVGNPIFTGSGNIAYTVDAKLYLHDENHDLDYSRDLSFDANWIDISSDNHFVAYSNAAEQIVLQNLKNNDKKIISDYQLSYCRPKWSPNGRQLLYQSIGGILFLYDVEAKKNQELGLGTNPDWSFDSEFIVASLPIFKGDLIVESRIIQYNLQGFRNELFSRDGQYAVNPVLSFVDGHMIFGIRPQTDHYGLNTSYYHSILNHGQINNRIQLDVPLPSRKVDINFSDISEGDRAPIPDLNLIYIEDVPYHNQRWDTKNSYNGGSCCGATSATMTIAYYNRFNDWDITVSSPFEHTSHYGLYITDIYSFSGYTFDIYGCSSNPSYGGHGYIWQKIDPSGGCESSNLDTKTHMVEYIEYHNIDSGQDWSVSWTKWQNEVSERTPFTVLSYITDSGHYTVATGYRSGYLTAVSNDPYGNKNQGNYGNFNGAGVLYDWPGENNGYENFNTVFCYIYADSTPPNPQPGSVDNPIPISSFPYSDINTTKTSGGSDRFDEYSCAPGVDERGREKVYEFTIGVSGTLTAEVICDLDVDIDVHLLGSLDENDCIIRDHTDFTQWISAGTYYIVCDTFYDSSMYYGTEIMGDYTLTCDFVPDVVVTATPTSVNTNTPTHVPTATPTPIVPIPVTNRAGQLVLIALLSVILLKGRFR